MIKTIELYPTRVCSSKVILTLEGQTIQQAVFEGGCEGNLEGICRLICGMNVHDVIQRLKGIDCDGKGTSCPDQLAKMLETHLDSSAS